MRLRTLLIVLMLVLVVAFAALNWPAFVTPTRLNLLFTSLDAPLGVVMLGILVAIVLAFALYMAIWQGTVLMETRRHTKEMQQQRELADQAEASRFTELRAVLHDEVERLNTRLGQSEQAMRAEIRDGASSVAAMIAELDDRLRRPGGAP